MTTTKQSSDHEHIEFTGAYTARRGFKKCGVCLEMYQSSDAIDEILKKTFFRAGKGPNGSGGEFYLLDDRANHTTLRQAIEKLLLEARIDELRLMQNAEIDKPGSTVDSWALEAYPHMLNRIAELQSLLNKTGESE